MGAIETASRVKASLDGWSGKPAPILGLALAVGALAACSGQPLGTPRNVDASTRPIGDAAALDFPAPTLGTIFPPDASTGPVESAACWAPLLPAPVQPIAPTSSVMDACAAGAAATSTDWTYPPNITATSGDDRRYIVGRWAVCVDSIFGQTAHAGLEFGANGRWRMLATDPTTGELVPMVRSETTSGYYYLLGVGQLNLATELASGGYRAYPVTFTAGMDAINFNNPTGLAEVYARTTPSPLNGADNPPPTQAGDCSLVGGDWELPGSGPPGAEPTLFSFDAAGNFVIGAWNANLCDSGTPYGTYALSLGEFQITTNTAGCPWFDGASYRAAFDASCSQLSLIPQTDNCTGGRIYFEGPTTLTRRAAGSGDSSVMTSP
jgi:hypothetical protein